MMMLITPGEDGTRIRFFATQDQLTDWLEDDVPSRWLSAEEAQEDPNYWPAGSAFLAGVTPLRIVPKEIAVSYEIEDQ